MTEVQLRRELKEGLCGAYLFYGDEEYLKNFYLSAARRHTSGEDGDDGLNSYKIRAEAGDFRLGELCDAVMSVPMFGGKVFVSYTADLNAMNKDELSALVSAIKGMDAESVVLIICPPAAGFDTGNIGKNKPSALYKTLSAVCKTVEFPIQSTAELKKWMGRRFARDGIEISSAAADYLLRRCGSSMYALSGELEKLAAYTLSGGKNVIDEETVALVTGENEEDSGFALANAVLEGDRRKALKVLNGCRRRKEEPPAVLGSVSRALCDMLAVSALASEGADKGTIVEKLKMHPYRAGLYLSAVSGRSTEQIAAAVRRCRDADLSLKSSRLDYIAVERLICTIPARPRKSVGTPSGGTAWKK